MPVTREERYSLGAGSDDPNDRWQEMLSLTHMPWTTRIDPGPEPFEADIERWRIGDLALVDCDCSPCSGTRQRRQIGATEGEFFVVLMTRSGRESVSQGETAIELGPGDILAWDSDTPARFAVLEQLSKRSLVIPRSALEEVCCLPWARPGFIRPDAAATQLLVGYLDTLAGSLPRLSAGATTAARNATLELLAGALRPDTDGIGSQAGPALHDAMDRFIESNLLDRALSPGMIACAHGVSVRTVNRVFNAAGQTVRDTIRIRRLARARDELAVSDTPIAALADKWGFADASHFSRTFKSFYGTSPSDFRGARVP
ncbi:MAG: helix-turn-helix domain-containing protein [Gordonia sp. (in: high G+C Gram-positive bacteria)]